MHRPFLRDIPRRVPYDKLSSTHEEDTAFFLSYFIPASTTAPVFARCPEGQEGRGGGGGLRESSTPPDASVPFQSMTNNSSYRVEAYDLNDLLMANICCQGWICTLNTQIPHKKTRNRSYSASTADDLDYLDRGVKWLQWLQYEFVARGQHGRVIIQPFTVGTVGLGLGLTHISDLYSESFYGSPLNFS